MPDGHLQRIDHTTGAVVVVRRGRTYAADVSDVEPHARVPGARVHFDIARTDGVDRARNVTLSAGARTNRRQRRFGDLTGARRPGAKVKTTAARTLGVDVTTQAIDVVTAWVVALAEPDRDAALSLYAPDATIHDGADTVRGRRHIAAFLERATPNRLDASEVHIAGDDQLVRVDWPDSLDQPSDWFAVVRGQVVEHWHRTEPDVEEPDDGAAPLVDVVVSGPVDARDTMLARERLEKLTADLDRPVRSTRMKLSVIDHATEVPVSGTASIDIDGTVLRSHVGARTVPDTIDQLVKRLQHQIDRFTDRHRDKSSSDAWRHESLPSERPDFFDRPASERSLVRHKSYTTDRATLEEALWDMHSLDYDFFLFTEATTGSDCLLWRGTDGIELMGMGDRSELPDHPTVSVAPMTPPRLSVSAAIAVLDESRAAQVFFENDETGRGNVVYRRYDGHHGLITPADA